MKGRFAKIDTYGANLHVDDPPLNLPTRSPMPKWVIKRRTISVTPFSVQFAQEDWTNGITHEWV